MSLVLEMLITGCSYTSGDGKETVCSLDLEFREQ